LTVDALLSIKAGISADPCAADVRAFVADFSPAIVALSGADLDRVLEGEADASMPALPAAMICAPSCLLLFKGHAQRMAGQRGITRRVFSLTEPAVIWARGVVARRPG